MTNISHLRRLHLMPVGVFEVGPAHVANDNLPHCIFHDQGVHPWDAPCGGRRSTTCPCAHAMVLRIIHLELLSVDPLHCRSNYLIWTWEGGAHAVDRGGLSYWLQ